MPCPSNGRVSVYNSELVGLEHLLQSTAHCNTCLASPNDEDWIVSVRLVIVAANMADAIRRFGHHALKKSGSDAEWKREKDDAPFNSP